MLPASLLMLLGSGIVGVQSATVAQRAPKPYLTVLTETDLSWLREFPDSYAVAIEIIRDPRPLNVTCWVFTTIPDTAPGYPLAIWVAVENPKSYIDETYLQAADIDFTEELAECPPVFHAEGVILEDYWLGNGEPFDPHIPCYDSPSIKPTDLRFDDITHAEILCYVENRETVNGNSTWGKLLKQDCYVPGSWFDPTRYYGYVGLC